MTVLVKAPDPVLSEKSKPVKKFDKPLLDTLKEMEEVLLSAKDPVGVGLAAPQIGKSLQIFIAKPTVKSKIFVYINPKIIRKKNIAKKDKKVKDNNKKLEGCLSLPNIWGAVKRFDVITLSYKDGAGKEHLKEFDGFISTIIQHEIDHLEGVLFPKRVLEQNGVLYKSKKNEKNEDIFEEIEI